MTTAFGTALFPTTFLIPIPFLADVGALVNLELFWKQRIEEKRGPSEKDGSTWRELDKTIQFFVNLSCIRAEPQHAKKQPNENSFFRCSSKVSVL